VGGKIQFTNFDWPADTRPTTPELSETRYSAILPETEQNELMYFMWYLLFLINLQ